MPDRIPQILDASGNPLKPPLADQIAGAKTNALTGGRGGFGGPPYDAADVYSQGMAAWSPYLWSPDAETNIYRDRIVSRVRDLVRNDGWASGVVTRILDNAIGGNLRPIAKPDYRYLAQMTGIKAFDHKWAKDFARATDALWRSWAGDSGCWCDAARNQTFTQMMWTSFRHHLIDGDALALVAWLPDRVGYGRARYSTAVQLIDSDRLSNPQQKFDQQSMRGGVQIDEYGAATGYWIRRAHQGDWWSAAESLTWDLVPRETDFGRPIIVHSFDAERAGQHRGGSGIFAPILARLKMLIKYDGTELDAAIINAIFSAYVESPFDHQLVAEAVDDGENVNFYQAARAEFHKSGNIVLGGARIPILFPGEKVNAVNASRPASNFREFEGTVLRNVAAGIGLSAQQVSNDWSDVNYSSARGALLEAWKTLDRRRCNFTEHFAAPIRGAWLEEAFEADESLKDVLPKNAPAFAECRAAYMRCRWMGPGRGWIDPVAEKQGAVMGMDAALSTLEDECAQQGLDYEEVLEQRRYELELFDEYDIPRPTWAGVDLQQQQQEPGAPGQPRKPGIKPGQKPKKPKVPQPPKK